MSAFYKIKKQTIVRYKFLLIINLKFFFSFADVTWAIINRGLLICDECCSIHRSLGRHISQLKSLNKGDWRSSQLNVNIIFLILQKSPFLVSLLDKLFICI